jgi:hypothetical protein
MITFQRTKKQSAPLSMKLQPLKRALRDASKSKIRFVLLDACKSCSNNFGTVPHPIDVTMLTWEGHIQ